MRSLSLAAISVALLSSSAFAGGWVQDQLHGRPILRFDGANFGIIVGCDNSDTFKFITISNNGTFKNLDALDKQFVLVADGKEISRKTAWRNAPVGVLSSYESFVPSHRMGDFVESSDSAEFIIGDQTSGEAVSFSADMSDFKEKSSELINYCSNIVQ